jgi:hypothetical protein
MYVINMLCYTVLVAPIGSFSVLSNAILVRGLYQLYNYIYNYIYIYIYHCIAVYIINV